MTRHAAPTQDPLFDIRPTAPLRRPRKPAEGSGPIRWAPYTAVHRHKCDDCLRWALEENRANRRAPLAREARHRMTQGGELVALLCGEHKHLRGGPKDD